MNGMLFFHVCLCTMCMSCSYRVRREHHVPKTEAEEGCEPLCVFWELNRGPL